MSKVHLKLTITAITIHNKALRWKYTVFPSGGTTTMTMEDATGKLKTLVFMYNTGVQVLYSCINRKDY